MQVIITQREFEKLYNDKYMQLYYLAYDYVGDEELSRDIVGEVFARMWKMRDRLQTETLGSYLYVSVRNLSLDHLHKQKQKTNFEKEFACSLEEFEVDDWEARDDRIRQMQHELKQMPERVQLVLKERFFNERSNQEVASQIGITEAGVKKLITRAFAHLRRRIK